MSPKPTFRTVFVCLIAGLGISTAGAGTCENLLSQIDTKLQRKGVKNYSLAITGSQNQSLAGKSVGSCEGGARKIVLTSL